MTIQTEETPGNPGVSSENPEGTGGAKLSDVAPAGIPSDEPVRPDYIPEKFWKDGKADLEGLAKSYAELETKFSAPKEPAPEVKEEAPKVDAEGKIVKQEEAAAEANPLTDAITAMQSEWAEKQEVSDDTFKSLEDLGVPRQIAETYLEGVKLIQQQALDSIHSFAGGEEAYNQMANWAAAKLTDAELDAYNADIADPARRENAVRGLYARFSAAVPSEGKMIVPNNGSGTGGDTYSSREEFVADTKNPAYSTDAKFRAEVAAKLARSQQQGFKVTDRPLFEKRVVQN